MFENEEITFNKFYLHEFYDAVNENAKLRFADKQYSALNSLISNLKSEKDYSTGIEILAREHGTSELSIFLFDIMDRINDYPPTMVFDSMPEMVDDFVNTLEVMLEEVTTLESLEKVNSSFISDKSQLEESAIEDQTRIQESQDNVVNFSEFRNNEFFENLNQELSNRTKLNEKEDISQFIKLLLENLQNPQLFNAPEQLTNIVEELDKIYIQPGSEISPTQGFQNIKKLMPGIVQKILSLEMDYPEIITESINTNSLVITEPSEKPVKDDSVAKEAETNKVVEEVEESSQVLKEPQQPSSIENLLSAYFQSEIEEYSTIFSKGFKKLKKDPHNIEELQELENKFHAFKEISMIHGYEIVESACANLMNLLAKIRTNKYEVSDQFFKSSKDLIKELKKCDQFKGKARSSEESEKLELIISRMSDALILESKKDKTSKKNKVEDEISKDIKQIDQEDDKLISLSDSESIFTVFKEFWLDIQPQLSSDLLEERNIDSSKKLLEKISSAAKLVKLNSISEFCNELISRLLSLQNLTENEINNGCAILFINQETVLSKLQPDFTQETGEIELNKFDSIFTKGLGLDETDTLLSILVEFERSNLEEFKDSISQIIGASEENERNKQNNNFFRLSKNLELLGLDDLRKFPDFYFELLNNKDDIKYDVSISYELVQSYKLFIENVEKNKSAANVNELVETLKEVISEITADEKVEPVKLDEEDIEAEIPDEDLDQIFKEEAKNYIWKIEDALALLETDSKHKKPFEEIEKNAHSLKASARLMGYDDITNICVRIENIAEYYLKNDFSVEADVLETIKSSVNIVIAFIDGEDKNKSEIESELIKIEEKLKSEAKKMSDVEAEKEDEVKESEEVDLFTDSENDEDLLDIFKEESSTYIKIIDKAIENLKKGVTNAEEIHQFEYASHSLKSAAKMLGFREIGQIADGFEQVAEALYKGEIENSDEMTNSLERSVHTIKSISDGKKIPATEITDIINLLDLNNITAKQEKDEELVYSPKRTTDKEDIDPMVDLFLKEAWEMIEKINRDLLLFEKNHDDSLIEALNRNVHTLKGSAQMMQFEKVGQIAHIVEDFLEQQIENKDTIPDDFLDPIFKAVDEIQIIMESIKSGKGEVSPNYEDILNNLRKIQTDEGTPENIEEKIKTLEPEKKAEEISVTKSLPKNIEQPQKTVSEENTQLIKITTDRLDNLINMAAELVINKTQLLNYVESLKKLGLDLDKDREVLKSAEYSLDDIILKRKYEQDIMASSDTEQDGVKKFGDLALISNDFKKTINTIDNVSSKFNNLTHGFEQNISRLASLIKMLHDDVLQVRMVPVEELFNRFPRAVRDLAKKQKKKIDLVIEGSNTEMDRAMIESLTDPIMHLVRNSVDHGIELPMNRKKAGKENTGKLILRAKQDKNQIIIEVEDDGKGINIDAVKDTIISKKILSKNEVNKLSTGEVLDYIFYPGFSTKKDTSKVSGRGIGLDVVASQVQKLKGDIRVNSTTGQGTLFSIRVPLTLIISQAMLFKLTDQILAIPLISVEESIQFNSSALEEEDGKLFINHRGEKIPTIVLNSLLKFSNAELSEELKAIIIQETGIRCVLIIDEILHREEIVIKSLGSHLQNLEHIAGGTILGDGSIALILDTTSIIRKIEIEYIDHKDIKLVVEKQKEKDQAIGNEKEIVIEKKKIKNRKPIALIVDDSISVRRFVASVLEKNNYDTVLASDGINALKEINDKSFDIVITDLEMPKMHGYELIEKIRMQKKLQELPIVILTGRAGKKHKDMGIKLGANAFIVKPFKDNDLLSTLKKFIDN